MGTPTPPSPRWSMVGKTNCSMWLASQRPYMYVSQILAGWIHKDPTCMCHRFFQGEFTKTLHVCVTDSGRVNSQRPYIYVSQILAGWIDKDPTCLCPRFWQGELTKTQHVSVTYSLWQAEITRNREKVVNRLRSPRVSPHYCFIGGVKFPKEGGSAVIHRKKSDPLHKVANTYNYVCVTYSLWKGEFTRNQKQVLNRLKIPQGLSTLLCRRWSEVPSRGGVRGDSP